MIVKVLINTSVVSLNKVYDYNVPYELENEIELGKRVQVNFGIGKGKKEEGIIVKVEKDKNKEDIEYKLKDIVSVLDEISYIDENKLKLAKYMAYIYFCNVYDVLKLMLPPGTASKNESKNMKDKFDIKLHLALSILEIEQKIEENIIKNPKHIKLLRFLEENNNVFIDDVVSGLGISKAMISTIEKNGYIVKEMIKQENNSLDIEKIPKNEKQIPTEEQQNAIDKILLGIDSNEFKKYLLFGVTGSGKTEVYMQVIEKVIKQNKKVIFLVPEISLTHQSVIRLVGRFGRRVAILHSKMKKQERKEEYKRIKNGQADIIIGARSAIFAPVSNLGMVILDEEHDPSYYSQTKPKYSTKEVAEYICRENNAILLLGSATPEITTYYNAINNNMELISMKNRASSGASLPEVIVVDKKEEKILGNNSFISRMLKEELNKVKYENNQAMVFLNRRGYQAYFRCDACHTIFKCPNCDIALTYHKKNNLLHCHYCSHVERNITMCPSCGSEKINVSTIGTEKLEEELKSINNDLKVLRLDADTTVSREALPQILEEFKNKKADILLGTQMISKGHDFPDVTLVGILGADNLLSISEYNSNERAYQNLSQVAGRAGRSIKRGKVIIETSETDNYVIEAVKNHDYYTFFDKEIEYRQIFEYPPFCDLVIFEMVSDNLELLKKDASKFYDILSINELDENNYFKVFSPKAPHVQKLNNKYRINILIKTKLNTNIYKYIYNKLDKYNKIKNKNIILTICKYPF